MENSNKKEIFCRFIRKNGKVIYPKNAKYFHFWVDDVAGGDKDLDSSESSNDLMDE